MRASSTRLWAAENGKPLLGEAGHRRRFGVEHFKYRQQLRDLQHFLELAAQVAKAQRCALLLRGMVRGHQRAQARAVNERDVVHVEHNFFLAFGQQTLHFLAERVALVAEHDPPIQRDHRHAIHFALRQFQSHVLFLLIGKRVRRQPVPSPKAYPVTSRFAKSSASHSVVVRARHIVAANVADEFAAP